MLNLVLDVCNDMILISFDDNLTLDVSHHAKVVYSFMYHMMLISFIDVCIV